MNDNDDAAVLPLTLTTAMQIVAAYGSHEL